MAANTQHTYVTTFAVAGKILASFKTTMAQANAAIHALNQRTRSATKEIIGSFKNLGGAVKALGVTFAALGTMFAGFLAANIFQRIFSQATEEAGKANERARQLFWSYKRIQQMQARGPDFIKETVARLQEFNEELAKGGVLSSEIYDNFSVTMAALGFSPRRIMDSNRALGDMLVRWKGIHATEEDSLEFIHQIQRVIQSPKPRMQAFLRMFPEVGADEIDRIKNAKNREERLRIILDIAKAYRGLNESMIKEPGGRTQLLSNMIRKMAIDIGKKVIPEQDKMAERWTKLLPKIQPVLEKITIGMMHGLERLADVTETKLLPAFEQRLFPAMLKALNATGKVFEWLVNNMDTLLPILAAIGVAFVALQVAANAWAVGIGAAIFALAKVASEYTKFHDLMEGHAVSDPDHFTKHWYLMNQTWTEMWAGLSAVFQKFIDGWNKSWAELEGNIKKAWDMAKKFADWAERWIPPLWLGKFIARHTAGVRASIAKSGQAYVDQMGDPIGETMAAYNASQQASESAYFAAQGRNPMAQANLGGSAIGSVGVLRAGYGAMGQGMPVTVASYGGPTEPGQTIGAYGNLLRPGDVAISPNLYPVLGSPGPNSYLMLDGKRYHIADASFYTPGHPTSNMVEIWGYGNQIKKAGTAARAYAEGGIAATPQLATLAERGPELVLPLEKMAGNWLSTGGGETHVSFAPNITVNGTMDSAASQILDRNLRELAQDFIAKFKAAQHQERRLSFESGYG